ncbi:MAG: LamG domain-containing protein [Abitibacteriaceae bacterium]|nr:LamG domain-containing protein [Abditibacteriaceae bacterium]
MSKFRHAFSIIIVACIWSASDAALAAPPPLPGQIETFYSAPVSAGLAGWWMGDGDVADSMGHNKARLYNGADYAPGKVGQGFHFDGLKSYAKIIATNEEIEAKDGLTVELWINPVDVSQKQPILGWSGGEQSGVYLWIEPAKKPGLAILGADVKDANGGSHVLVTGAGVVRPNTFQHIALTYDMTMGEAILYYNARPVALQLMDVFKPNTRLDLWLGRHPAVDGGNTLFDGVLDEVSVYRRALSAGEIDAINKAGSAGKTVLVAISPQATEAQRADAEEQAYQNRLKSFSEKDKTATLTLNTLIDGSDEVHIQGDKLWYVHHDFAFPGKYGNGNLPTLVNLEEWIPDWTGNISSKYDKLDPPLLTTGADAGNMVQMRIDVLRAGGPVTVQQTPTPENNYEAILYLDDVMNFGAHWYSFSVNWKVVPKPATTSGLQA